MTIDKQIVWSPAPENLKMVDGTSNIFLIIVSYAKFAEFFKNDCCQAQKHPIRHEKLHFMH